MKGVKSIGFGYGGKPSIFKRVFGVLDYPEDVTKIIFHRGIKNIDWRVGRFSDYKNKNLNKIVNPPTNNLCVSFP